MMDLERFRKRLESARETSSGRTSPAAMRTDPALAGLLAVLEESWEELQVAEVDLRQQNDELIAARDAVEAERARYQALFDEAPVGHIVTDALGVVREANRHAQALFETSGGSIVGKPLVLFMHESTKSEIGGRLSSVGAASIVDWPVTLVSRSGRPFPASVTASVNRPREDGGEILWVVRDMSDLERAVASRTAELEIANRVTDALLRQEQELRERAEQTDRAKDAFLATLSHELRTPVTALVGWVHLLRHGRLDGPTRQRALDAVERSTQAQVKLVNDILDVSRIIAGKLHLETLRVDLVPIVSAAVNLLLPLAEGKRLTLHFTCECPQAWLQGDPDRLQQVTWNLLSNAMKFTPTGGTIGVRMTANDSSARVEITDTGVGIDPAFLPQVFDRFRQADDSATRQHGGLGLGLAISRYLVESHGGTVEARSEGPGLGSTFSFVLPILNRDLMEPPNETANDPADTKVRILLVEDDRDTREMLVVALGLMDVEAHGVASVAEALGVLPNVKPDVIVSDIGLPGEDGFALIAHVRQLSREQGGLTPAVALSGYLAQDSRRRALESGFQVLVTKPVNPEQLADVVRELASRRRTGGA